MDTLQNVYLFGTIVLLIVWTVMVVKDIVRPQHLYIAFLFIVLWPVVMPLYILLQRKAE